jgi:hypothetical protein
MIPAGTTSHHGNFDDQGHAVFRTVETAPACGSNKSDQDIYLVARPLARVIYIGYKLGKLPVVDWRRDASHPSRS